MSFSDRRCRRDGSEGRGVGGKYNARMVIDFESKCPSYPQPVLKTSTGTHPFAR